MISMDKKYVTRLHKLPVRIVAINRKSVDNYPVVGLIDNGQREILASFSRDGKYQTWADHEWDLIEVKPEKTLWLNVFDDGSASFHSSREVADYTISPRRFACVQLTVKQGQGL